jgi:hypothetical protein
MAESRSPCWAAFFEEVASEATFVLRGVGVLLAEDKTLSTCNDVEVGRWARSETGDERKRLGKWGAAAAAENDSEAGNRGFVVGRARLGVDGWRATMSRFFSASSRSGLLLPLLFLRSGFLFSLLFARSGLLFSLSHSASSVSEFSESDGSSSLSLSLLTWIWIEGVIWSGRRTDVFRRNAGHR